MEIKRIIIHEIEKNAGELGAKSYLYDSLLDKTRSQILNLIKELNNRYKKKTETYGIFNANEPTKFHDGFNAYYCDMNDENFIFFSKEATKDLKIRIENVVGAKGGYVVYADYEYYKHYLGVFIVRNKLGTGFSSNRKSMIFNVEDISHIDFENLAMACRINIEFFKSSNIQYLSFINKTNKDISYFFTQWVSSDSSMINNKENTKRLLKLLHNAESPSDENGNVISKDEFKDRVYNFINTRPNKIIDLLELSNHFYGDECYLRNIADKNDIIINGEFKADTNILKKLISIQIKADNIELKFKLADYHDKKIRFDRTDSSQIIIKSEILSKAVCSEIEKNE